MGYRLLFLIPLLTIIWVSFLFGGENGTIVINSRPERVDVHIDSVYYGRTPLKIENLPPGPYRILLTRKNYNNAYVLVELDTLTQKITVKLKKKYARLQVDLEPGDAGIFVYSKRINDSLKIPYGKYSILFNRDGYFAQKRKVVVNNSIYNLSPVRLKPKSKTTALAMSMIIPGMGQIYSDRSWLGAPMMLASISSLTYLLHPRLGYNGAKYNYELRKEIFENSSDYFYYENREKLIKAYDKLEHEYKVRKFLIPLTAAVWVLNIWDVYKNFPESQVDYSKDKVLISFKTEF